MENDTKRGRAANFSNVEVDLLMNLVCKHKLIIENKKTDTVTNKDKEVTWQKIAHSFNSKSGATLRTAKALKLKYEGIKKVTKEKSAFHRRELYKTGGGESTAPVFTEVEEKVVSICSNIHGLDARHDSDEIPDQLLTPGDEISFDFNHEQVETLPEEITILSGTITPAEVVVVSNTDENTVCTKEFLIEDNKKSNDNSTSSWRTWTPHILKNKITPALKRNITKASVNSKLDELSAARLELIQMQKQALEKENICKQMEHEQILKQRKEEHEVRMLHMLNAEKRRNEEHELKMKQYKLS